MNILTLSEGKQLAGSVPSECFLVTCKYRVGGCDKRNVLIQKRKF